MRPFAAGNIGVSVGADGIALVDDKFEPLVPKIEAALKGISDQPVRFVLNTHFHGDHTHGNKVFGRKSTIIAHDNLRKAPADGHDLREPRGHEVKGYVAAVEKVLGELPEDVKIIPGHGPLASRADLAAYLAMLKETSALVQKGIDQGQTVEQLVAAKPLAKWDSWSWFVLTSDGFVKQLDNGLRGVARRPS